MNSPQRIVITGASRGIGRSIALRLAKNGVHLILQGRDRALLEDVAKECRTRSATTEQHIVELSDLQKVNEFGALISEQPVDVLINNAGIALGDTIEHQPITEWELTMTVNLYAPVILTKSVLPKMQAGSSIVNIASMSSFTGHLGLGSYCASKFALEGFTQTLRLETQPRGIRVIGIYPSSTATDIWRGKDKDVTKLMSPDDIAEGVATALALPATTLLRTLTMINTLPI